MGEPDGRRVVIPFAVGVLTSAYLLFQVQPMIARQILPWYGGSPAVWTTCMLFFQVSLLAGYLYTHLLAKWLRPRRQVVLHLALLGLSLLSLPIAPDEAWKPSGAENPMLSILRLLTGTVGFPYVLLSASAPLLQHWFSRVSPESSPYRLYAVSNLGSLLGLLLYPFVVEPALSLRSQSWGWSAGYGLFALVCAWSASPLLRHDPGGANPGATTSRRDPLRPGQRLLWLALAACGSVMLLAITNQVCLDVAVVPFLWVAPLSLYLLSFIISFDAAKWYNRSFWVPLLAASVVLVVILLHRDYADTEWPLLLQIAIYLSALFVCCMVCHGELARRKPHASRLTSFYLMVALGGALGGVFVNLVAPLVFDGYWELHLGLVATVVLFGVCALWGETGWDAGPYVPAFRTAWGLAVLGLAIPLWMHRAEQTDSSIVTRRSFYGVLNVYEFEVDEPQHHYSLYHGRINHGMQFRRGRYRFLPTTYYDFDSGIGVAIGLHPRRRTGPLKVGVIGLGVGTIAAFGRSGDEFLFYEINPEVQRLAEEYFSYLSDTSGDNRVVLGDGRISLERELRESGSRRFDVLALDAFSGDGVPVHLLTREAFELYWRHLRPDGILAVHMTSLHFDLSDPTRVLARELGKQALLVTDEGERFYDDSSDWVLLTSNRRFLADPALPDLLRRWPRATPREIRWTDDFSNLLSVLVLDESQGL